MSSGHISKPTPNHLKRYRLERRLLVKDLARMLGILNPWHVWQWETGRRTPTLKTAIRLSAAIGCPLEFLFFDDFEAARRYIEERKRRLRKNHAS